MKKILFSLLAIVGLVSSCTNDEIEVESYNDLTYNVSTQSVYEKFGIADDFKSKFLSGSYNIGVFTYVYDQEGVLVVSDSVYTKTFGKIEQDFSKLKVGKYTAITIEMLVDADNDYQSERWIILGQDKQSTLEVANRSFMAYWYDAVGVATTELNIERGKTISYDVTPDPIGSIIHCTFQNFDKSNYKCLALFSKDEPFGRYVSPTITGADRFHYEEYNESNVWSFRGFVLRDDLPNTVVRTVYVLEEGNFNYCFGAIRKDSNGDLETKFHAIERSHVIKDGDWYYGGMVYVGGSEPNDYDGIIFDTYEEFNQWAASQQFVESGLVIYPNITVEWGSDAQTVTNAMGQKSITVNAEETNDNNYILTFLNDDVTSLYDCYFETDKTNLSRVIAVTMDQSSVVLNSLKTNYTYMGYDSDVQAEILMNGTTVVFYISGEKRQTMLYYPMSSMSAPQKDKPTIASEPEYVTLPTINKEFGCIAPISSSRAPLYSGKIEQLKKNKKLIEQIKSLKEHADVKLK